MVQGDYGKLYYTVSLDGQNPPPGVPQGVAGVAASKVRVIDAIGRSVVGVFNGERVVGRAWPAAGNEVTFLELTF